MQISISDLRKYLSCPRSYWLSEMQGIEPETKSLAYCRSVAVKQIISLLHENQKTKPSDCSKQEISDLCRRVWNAVIDDEKVSKEELDTVVVKAKKATKSRPETPAITRGDRILANIQNWIFEYPRQEVDAETIATNIYFQTDVGNITLVGYIDLIRKVNDNLQVVIFNSSSTIPHETYLENDFILSIYSHAIWQGSLFPSYPNLEDKIELNTLPEICLYYLPNLERYLKNTGKFKKGEKKGNPVIDVTRTEEELSLFEYELLYAISGIQNDFFPKMPSTPCGCALCPYQNSCKEQSIFQSPQDTSFNVEEFEQQEVSV